MRTQVRTNFQGALVLSKMNLKGDRLIVKTYMGYSRKQALQMFRYHYKQEQ